LLISLKKQHYIAIGATLVLIVLLFFAPRHSGGVVSSAEDVAENNEPPSVENQIDSALAMIASEAPMQGILFLRQIAEENPSNFRAQLNLGRFSAQTGQWEKVIERFEIVQKIDPEFSESNYWLGLAKFNLNRPVEAKAHFVAFLDSEKDNEELRNEAQIMLNQIP
jgi:tetratricopeptide (TPR) repeat protein